MFSRYFFDAVAARGLSLDFFYFVSMIVILIFTCTHSIISSRKIIFRTACMAKSGTRIFRQSIYPSSAPQISGLLLCGGGSKRVRSTVIANMVVMAGVVVATSHLGGGAAVYASAAFVSPPLSSSPPPLPPPVKLGFINALSGLSPSVTVFLNAIRQGIEVAVAFHNTSEAVTSGRRRAVELLIRDNRGNATVHVPMLDALLRDHPDLVALLCLNIDQILDLTVPVLEREQLTLVGPSTRGTALRTFFTPSLLYITPPSLLHAVAMARYLVETLLCRRVGFMVSVHLGRAPLAESVNYIEYLTVRRLVEDLGAVAASLFIADARLDYGLPTDIFFAEQMALFTQGKIESEREGGGGGGGEGGMDHHDHHPQCVLMLAYPLPSTTQFIAYAASTFGPRFAFVTTENAAGQMADAVLGLPVGSTDLPLHPFRSGGGPLTPRASDYMYNSDSNFNNASSGTNTSVPLLPRKARVLGPVLGRMVVAVPHALASDLRFEAIRQMHAEAASVAAAAEAAVNATATAIPTTTTANSISAASTIPTTGAADLSATGMQFTYGWLHTKAALAILDMIEARLWTSGSNNDTSAVNITRRMFTDAVFGRGSPTILRVHDLLLGAYAGRCTGPERILCECNEGGRTAALGAFAGNGSILPFALGRAAEVTVPIGTCSNGNSNRLQAASTGSTGGSGSGSAGATPPPPAVPAAVSLPILVTVPLFVAQVTPPTVVCETPAVEAERETRTLTNSGFDDGGGMGDAFAPDVHQSAQQRVVCQTPAPGTLLHGLLGLWQRTSTTTTTNSSSSSSSNSSSNNTTVHCSRNPDSHGGDADTEGIFGPRGGLRLGWISPGPTNSDGDRQGEAECDFATRLAVLRRQRILRRPIVQYAARDYGGGEGGGGASDWDSHATNHSEMDDFQHTNASANSLFSYYSLFDRAGTLAAQRAAVRQLRLEAPLTVIALSLELPGRRWIKNDSSTNRFTASSSHSSSEVALSPTRPPPQQSPFAALLQQLTQACGRGGVAINPVRAVPLVEEGHDDVGKETSTATATAESSTAAASSGPPPFDPCTVRITATPEQELFTAAAYAAALMSAGEAGMGEGYEENATQPQPSQQTPQEGGGNSGRGIASPHVVRFGFIAAFVPSFSSTGGTLKNSNYYQSNQEGQQQQRALAEDLRRTAAFAAAAAAHHGVSLGPVVTTLREGLAETLRRVVLLLPPEDASAATKGNASAPPPPPRQAVVQLLLWVVGIASEDDAAAIVAVLAARTDLAVMLPFDHAVLWHAALVRAARGQPLPVLRRLLIPSALGTWGGNTTNDKGSGSEGEGCDDPDAIIQQSLAQESKTPNTKPFVPSAAALLAEATRRLLERLMPGGDPSTPVSGPLLLARLYAATSITLVPGLPIGPFSAKRCAGPTASSPDGNPTTATTTGGSLSSVSPPLLCELNAGARKVIILRYSELKGMEGPPLQSQLENSDGDDGGDGDGNGSGKSSGRFFVQFETSRVVFPAPLQEGRLVLRTIVGAALGSAVFVFATAAILTMYYRRVVRPRLYAPRDPSKPFTMVFTDVQSSTALWAEVPEVMAAAMPAHHKMLRAAIAKHKGYEVRTMGDAFVVAFQDAGDALRFGVSVQFTLYRHRWHDDGAIEELYARSAAAAGGGRGLRRPRSCCGARHHEERSEERDEEEEDEDENEQEVELKDLSPQRHQPMGDDDERVHGDAFAIAVPSAATPTPTPTTATPTANTPMAGRVAAAAMTMPPPFRGLRVRVGMHTGLGTIATDPNTSRFDYGGPVAVVAAAVQEAARGGEVLVTAACRAHIECPDKSIQTQTKQTPPLQIRLPQVQKVTPPPPVQLPPPPTPTAASSNAPVFTSTTTLTSLVEPCTARLILKNNARLLRDFVNHKHKREDKDDQYNKNIKNKRIHSKNRKYNDAHYHCWNHHHTRPCIINKGGSLGIPPPQWGPVRMVQLPQMSLPLLPPTSPLLNLPLSTTMTTTLVTSPTDGGARARNSTGMATMIEVYAVPTVCGREDCLFPKIITTQPLTPSAAAMAPAATAPCEKNSHAAGPPSPLSQRRRPVSSSAAAADEADEADEAEDAVLVVQSISQSPSHSPSFPALGPIISAADAASSPHHDHQRRRHHHHLPQAYPLRLETQEHRHGVEDGEEPKRRGLAVGESGAGGVKGEGVTGEDAVRQWSPSSRSSSPAQAASPPPPPLSLQAIMPFLSVVPPPPPSSSPPLPLATIPPPTGASVSPSVSAVSALSTSVGGLWCVSPFVSAPPSPPPQQTLLQAPPRPPQPPPLPSSSPQLFLAAATRGSIMPTMPTADGARGGGTAGGGGGGGGGDIATAVHNNGTHAPSSAVTAAGNAITKFPHSHHSSTRNRPATPTLPTTMMPTRTSSSRHSIYNMSGSSGVLPMPEVVSVGGVASSTRTMTDADGGRSSSPPSSSSSLSPFTTSSCGCVWRGDVNYLNEAIHQSNNNNNTNAGDCHHHDHHYPSLSTRASRRRRRQEDHRRERYYSSHLPHAHHAHRTHAHEHEHDVQQHQRDVERCIQKEDAHHSHSHSHSHRLITDNGGQSNEASASPPGRSLAVPALLPAASCVLDPAVVLRALLSPYCPLERQQWLRRLGREWGWGIEGPVGMARTSNSSWVAPPAVIAQTAASSRAPVIAASSSLSFVSSSSSLSSSSSSSNVTRNAPGTGMVMPRDGAGGDGMQQYGDDAVPVPPSAAAIAPCAAAAHHNARCSGSSGGGSSGGVVVVVVATSQILHVQEGNTGSRSSSSRPVIPSRRRGGKSRATPTATGGGAGDGDRDEVMVFDDLVGSPTTDHHHHHHGNDHHHHHHHHRQQQQREHHHQRDEDDDGQQHDRQEQEQDLIRHCLADNSRNAQKNAQQQGGGVGGGGVGGVAETESGRRGWEEDEGDYAQLLPFVAARLGPIVRLRWAMVKEHSTTNNNKNKKNKHINNKTKKKIDETRDE